MSTQERALLVGPEPHEQTPVIQMEPLITIDVVTRWFGVTRPTVYALMERESLPYIKIGKSLRFSPPSLRSWLAEHEQTHEE